MGARTDEAEQRVRQQRQQIARNLDALEARVRRDMETSKVRARETADEVSARARTMASDVPGSDAVIDLVTQHPLVSVLGTFGAGIAAGMMGEGGDSNRGAPHASEASRNGGSDARGGGGLSSLIDQFTGMAVTAVAGPMRREVESFTRDTVHAFFDGARSSNGAHGSNATQAVSDPVSPNREPGKA